MHGGISTHDASENQRNASDVAQRSELNNETASRRRIRAVPNRDDQDAELQSRYVELLRLASGSGDKSGTEERT